MPRRVPIEEMHTIERAVYLTIFACLDASKKETIEISNEYFDFFLPNGAHKLGWPQGTYVEVKYRLIYDSFTRIRYIYDRINPSKLVVVFTSEEETPVKYTSDLLHNGRNIEIISYKELRNRIKDNKVLSKSAGIDNEITYQKEKEASVLFKVKEAIKNNKISIFIGAGVSASAGVATWNYLLEKLCVKRKLAKIDNDIDSVIKGRYIIEEYKHGQKDIPEEFYKDIRDILYANIKPSKLIESIASLIINSDIESIISYNYDNLVEREVEKKDKLCYPVYDKSRPRGKEFLSVYHVHGYVSQEDEYSPIVLGEQEYHKIFQESYNWGNVEQLHALCRSTCLFIGLSMNDPNLRRLIDISVADSEVEPVHYAFLRKIEYDVPFMEKVMRGFGINCVWYENYEDLPDILDSIIESNK